MKKDIRTSLISTYQR